MSSCLVTIRAFFIAAIAADDEEPFLMWLDSGDKE